MLNYMMRFNFKVEADLYSDIIKVLDLGRKDAAKLLRFNLEEKNEDQWFTEVKLMTPGQSFGELALINDVPRAATIKCNQECYFATIQREEYEKVLKRIELKAQ